MKSAKEFLKIDEKNTICRIEGYIRGVFDYSKAKGVLIGLSGGIDSAVLSTLVVRALGKDKVSVYYVYDKNNDKESEQKARIMADWLGLKLNILSIASKMNEKELKAPFFMGINGLPKFMVSGISGLYRLIMGEMPYVSTLRKRSTEGNRFKRWIYNHTVKNIEFMFDGGAIERRKVLEEIAEKEGLLILGAANRSEEMTGWFTSGGIDNMPFAPIMGLYKNQVRQLAAYLDVPPEIQKQESSPDMLKGVNDELTLGIDYDRMDIILCGLVRGLKDEDIMEYGPTKIEIEKIREMRDLSDWKRAVENISRPACVNENMID
ncbi:MAG: NAD(+) synthase [Candidatus Omnitrophica bacterium]|nr:NAD(+) synthase [Candidatus Omnitrophota bacterium]MBU4488788.1 NAD(+) synthase [Candidatus Omnitrophota bacterium]MCG2705445.1 NAD(+) synthase [Candidatus Omnitrophota bacterium]